MSRSTQNKSFWRRSPSQSAGLVWNKRPRKGLRSSTNSDVDFGLGQSYQHPQ